MSCANDLVISKGATRVLSVTVLDSTNAPVNIAAATLIEFTAKTAIGAPDPGAIFASMGLGDIVIDPQSGDTLGRFTVTLSSAKTNIAAGTYIYDVVLVIAGARYYVIKPAEIVIEPVVNEV
jgi:hypothetical protein